MSAQIINRISDNYQTALAVHRELADIFWFLSLPGYAMLHEYQHLDESLAQRKVKNYITTTYHMYVPDKLPKTANIAEPLLNGKNRKALKADDTWKIIKESFEIYREWEEGTLKEYQKIAKELFENGEISAFNFVGEIIRDVKAELIFLNDKIIELNAMNWDMPNIVAEQTELYERYEYLMRNVLGKSMKYHHYNSAVTVEDKRLD